MTEKERMLAGRLYIANDKELAEDFRHAKRLTGIINNLTEDQLDYRNELFRELFKGTGENIRIELPFRCDYGCHTTVGDNFFANYDCIIIDVCDVTIGNNVFFGPRVCVYTAGHPIDADIRDTQLEYGKKVSVGNSVWIGGNTVINPGVHIGDNVVIGSGSVVTKDIPSNVVAAGNPCRVLREITEQDKSYWKKEADEYMHDKG